MLTALTLVFGTDPGGGYEHAWLGCCGVYFQPSEPLKLLLIVYLAAYLADRLPLSLRALPLFAPTAVIMGIALLLLAVQRDLGTASIFIFLYTIILFIASGKETHPAHQPGRAGWLPALPDISFLTWSVCGWMPGSTPGSIHPAVHSRSCNRSWRLPMAVPPGADRAWAAPVWYLWPFLILFLSQLPRKPGWSGSLGLLALIGFFVARGLRTAMRAPDSFRRILAAGLTAYIGAQSILIIGGNIRLLPLTGVTLPFVSYGGSSLLTSFLALLILLFISSQPEDEPAPLPAPQPYLILAGLIGLGLFCIGDNKCLVGSLARPGSFTAHR